MSANQKLAFGQKILAFNDYFFSNISSVIFIVAIIVYIYHMLIDYRESVRNGTFDDIENNNMISKRMWKWTFLVMLFSGFFISSYCLFRF